MKIESVKKNEDGSVTFTITKPTKVEQAFSLWWVWLHEVSFETAKDAHPSWRDYTKNTMARIREIKATMTEEEKKELNEKINPRLK